MVSRKKISRIFDFLAYSDQLKRVIRWKSTPQMTEKESSADHSWHLTFLSYLFAEELDLKVDLLKSLEIALIHDIVETIADDVDAALIIKGIEDPKKKARKEKAAIKKLSASLPEDLGQKILGLWFEYENKSTKEGRFVYAMDKIEGIHHMVYKGHQSFHYEDVVGKYPNDAVSNFPELRVVLKEHQKRLKPEMKKHNWQWKNEYEIKGLDDLSESQSIMAIFDFVKVSEKLKETKRWLNTKTMAHKESSADHSWHLALICFLFADSLNLKIDLLKSIKMALVHDLVEAIVGDTDQSLIYFGLMTAKDKENKERQAIQQIRKMLPEKTGSEIYSLWEEYESSQTEEAKFVKALDKIESINYMLNLGHQCFDTPELIAIYPKKKVSEYQKLKYVYYELLDRIEPEYKAHGWQMDQALYDFSNI